MELKLRASVFLLLTFISSAELMAEQAAASCTMTTRKPIPKEIMTPNFMAAHPDMDGRAKGLVAYRKNDFTQAFRDFTRASSYADKFSQSMIAHMYWNGHGISEDKALAYVWMDLAAERGYHNFIRQREIYWAALSDAERADALQRGGAVYDRYGDQHAKPRMERELKRVTRRITGSRTGFVSSGLEISYTDGAGKSVVVPGHVFFSKHYYDPAFYWCTQDAYWQAPLNPNVEVGELEQLRDPLLDDADEPTQP